MAEKIITKPRSRLFRIHLNEVWKSALTGLITTIIAGIVALADNGKHIPSYLEVWSVVYPALISFIATVGRIILSNSQGQCFKGEKKAKKIQEPTA